MYFYPDILCTAEQNTECDTLKKVRSVKNFLEKSVTYTKINDGTLVTIDNRNTIITMKYNKDEKLVSVSFIAEIWNDWVWDKVLYDHGLENAKIAFRTIENGVDTWDFTDEIF